MTPDVAVDAVNLPPDALQRVVIVRGERLVTLALERTDLCFQRRLVGADRVVMLYPLSRLAPEEPQVVFEGSSDEVFDSDDPRVHQFVRGEAGERLQEMAAA